MGFGSNDYLSVLGVAYHFSMEFLSNIDDRPVGGSAYQPEYSHRFDMALSDDGDLPYAALEEWFALADPGIVASAGGRFFGFVVGGVTPAALGGDWLASALDQSGGIWTTSPAAAETELAVLRWLKELFHLPEEWSGVMTNGATTANLIGLAAARQWAGELQGYDPAVDGLFEQPRTPVIVSESTHSSVIKALGTLGFGRAGVERIPAPNGRLDSHALAATLEQIARPVIVVATAGEVNTGQFDDLQAIASLCEGHASGAWLHVDAAFGLFAGASPHFSHRIRGIERANSVASDAHKWLNVPYDSGFVFVRDDATLRRTFSTSSPYLSGSGGWDADDISPEMSRRFRALPAWCSLRSYGRSGYRSLVERCVDHAMSLAMWIEITEGMELLNRESFIKEPFNIVCFRYIRDGMTGDELEELNREATTFIQTIGHVFVSGTRWNGVTALRAAFVNWSTTAHDVEWLKSVLARTGEWLDEPDFEDGWDDDER